MDDALPDGTARPDPAALADALVAWQRATGRTLSVREATEPWAVLVAEVMSQQTQIARVGPRLDAFLGRWPDPAALAAASTRDLLEAWAGLGYNRRALALREAARAVERDHGGRVPDTLEGLRRLPGVGPYTARAVLAIAFGQPVAPLDVNVRRVVRRILGTAASGNALQVAADGLASRTEPRRWVWAVMDLAATVCTRRAPACGGCPVRDGCADAGSAADERTTGERIPFPATNRWLRGTLLRTLRAAPPGAWVELDDAIGVHPAAAVRRALAALEAEGFVERAGARARIPP